MAFFFKRHFGNNGPEKPCHLLRSSWIASSPRLSSSGRTDVGTQPFAMSLAGQQTEPNSVMGFLDFALSTFGAYLGFVFQRTLSHGCCIGLFRPGKPATLGRPFDFQGTMTSNFLAGWKRSCRGVPFFLVQRHFGHVNQTLNAWLQFSNKCTVIGDVGWEYEMIFFDCNGMMMRPVWRG